MTMASRRSVLAAGAALTSWTGVSHAQGTDTLRIGVLTDMSGPYRDVSGPTSAACARQAVEDFALLRPDIRAEIVVGDHQNRPDLASAMVREWFDRRGVDVIVDVVNTPVALACNTVAQEKDKIQLNTSAGSSDLTGKYCGPNFVHWTYDTWCLAHASGTAVVRSGGDDWFFITADYAFGHAAQADTARFVAAAGGRVVGAARYPFPSTTDFSSFLLQAQASRAKVVAFANAGDDLINCVKQAHEFGLVRRGVRLVALVGFITDVKAIGLQAAQGLTMTETFYWDLNDRTRRFAERVRPKLAAGVHPNMNHAGAYSAVLHYLKTAAAMGVSEAKASGRATIGMMKRLPTDDDCFGPGAIRPDGRKVHPAYLLRVKAPAESREPGDVYRLIETIPADQAFRPLDQGGCAFSVR